MLVFVCLLLAGTAAADEEEEEEDAAVLDELLVSSAMSKSGRESSVLSSLEEVLRFRRFGLLTASAVVVVPVLRGDESTQSHVLLGPTGDIIGWRMENADVVGTTVHSPPLNQETRAVATNTEQSLDITEFPSIFGWIGCRLCRRLTVGFQRRNEVQQSKT
jgi:hypothetical protein